MATTKDQVVPGDKWEFDSDVAACFDDMLERSIPDYEGMRRIVFEVGKRFYQSGTDIVDLGCSRGGALAPFVKHFGAVARFVGVEVSEPMRKAAEERFGGYIEAGNMAVLDKDLRKAFPLVRASVILSVLTLQFAPIEHRPRIIRDVFKSLVPGGAFVFVEKVLGRGADNDELFVDAYYDRKKEQGYTQEDIDRKRLSLEGVLVPVTDAHNETFLKDAGFHRVECIWRHLNFAGWVAVKPEGVPYQGCV